MKIFFYALLLLSTLCIAFIVFIMFSKFQVKKVIIISRREVKGGLSILNKQNILLLNKKSISQYIIQKSRRIKSIKISKVYPSTLILEIKFNDPKAIVEGEGNSSKLYYIDKEGFLSTNDKIQETNLPVIKVSNIVLSDSGRADWRVIKALSLLEDISQAGLIIDQISIGEKDTTFRFVLGGSTEVLVSQKSDSLNIATSLQIIMSRFRIEGKSPARIDLRFDKPVVILKNEEKTSSF